MQSKKPSDKKGMGPREQQLREMREARAEKAALSDREARTMRAKRLIDKVSKPPLNLVKGKSKVAPQKVMKRSGRGR